jgi:hypothetical protein
MSMPDDIDDIDDIAIPLSAEQQRIADLCARARAIATETAGQRIRKLTWEQWRTVLDAFAALDAEHRWGSSPRWFYDALDEHGLTALIASPDNTPSLHSMVSCLRNVIRNREAVEEWYGALPPDKQRRWVSPRSIVKHCPACGGGDPETTLRQNLMGLIGSYEEQQQDKRNYQHRIRQLEHRLRDRGIALPQPKREYAAMVDRERVQEEQLNALVRALRGGD